MTDGVIDSAPAPQLAVVSGANGCLSQQESRFGIFLDNSGNPQFFREFVNPWHKAMIVVLLEREVKELKAELMTPLGSTAHLAA